MWEYTDRSQGEHVVRGNPRKFVNGHQNRCRKFKTREPFYPSDTTKRVYCKCGCGTEIGTWDRTHRNRYFKVPRIFGEPKQYAMGHAIHDMPPPKRPPNPEIVPNYRRWVEKIIGRLLPKGSVVHHVDENRLNNRNDNLVVCEDESYHRLLHRRMNALRVTGNPNSRFCPYCKRWDDPSDAMYLGDTQSWHKGCYNVMQRLRRKETKCQNKYKV